MRTKHIDICHNFMRDTVDEKDTDMKYIRSKEKSANIMTENSSNYDHTKHTEIIMEG